MPNLVNIPNRIQKHFYCQMIFDYLEPMQTIGTLLLGRCLFAVYSYFIVLLWGITKQIETVVIGHYWSVGEILPSAFGVRQYLSNFVETISNSDLNTSHYLYNGLTCGGLRWVGWSVSKVQNVCRQYVF